MKIPAIILIDECYTGCSARLIREITSDKAPFSFHFLLPGKTMEISNGKPILYRDPIALSGRLLRIIRGKAFRKIFFSQNPIWVDFKTVKACYLDPQTHVYLSENVPSLKDATDPTYGRDTRENEMAILAKEGIPSGYWWPLVKPSSILLAKGKIMDENLTVEYNDPQTLFQRIVFHNPLDRNRAGQIKYQNRVVSRHLPSLASPSREPDRMKFLIEKPYFDVELSFLDPPVIAAGKARYYKKILSRDLPKLEISRYLQTSLPEKGDKSIFWGQNKSSGFISHQGPLYPGQGQWSLIGLKTFFRTKQFESSFSLDIWRCLLWDDLMTFVHEQLRIADFLHLIFTISVSSEVMLNDTDYLYKALRGHLNVGVIKEGDEMIFKLRYK